MPNRSILGVLTILSSLLLSACGGSPDRPGNGALATHPPASPSPASPARTSTPATATQSPSPQPAQTSQPPTPTPGHPMCSPLEGVALPALPDLVVNPFNPPPPGSDDPHQGVDFADRQAGDGIALAGRGVRAALTGRVVGVMRDRFPYGNALLVETPLDNLPATWLGGLLPTPGPTLAARSALTCPEGFSVGGDPVWRSLYLLYAHLQAPPTLQMGESVRCGQAIGAIGSSGNALNPHLHLEARIGPAAAQFESLAHYDPSATLAEMSNYCAWRVSGRFQALDPLSFLK